MIIFVRKNGKIHLKMCKSSILKIPVNTTFHCQSTGRSYEKKHAICPVKAPMRPMPVTAAALSSPLPPLHPSQKFLGTTEGHRRTSESFSRIIERFSQNPNTKRVTNPTKGIRIVSGEI